MSADKRNRSANWLTSEKELLLSLVEFHYNIIGNKKTDGVTMKTKLAQWQVIADQYNSRTTHCSRTADNLKAQWESMKKVARKDAVNHRKHLIQTGCGARIPTKVDPVLQRILNLTNTSAVWLFNPVDSDSAVPALQDQATTSVDTNDKQSSLEQLHQKKIEALELQKKLALEEMERHKVTHDLDVKIKKQILLQEKIKTNMLMIRRRKLLAHVNSKKK